MTVREQTRAMTRSMFRNAYRPEGGSAWTPASLGSNRLQDISSLSYSATKLNNLPIIPSAIGTLAQPRGQRCYLADGVDDYIAVASLTGSETVTSKQGTSTVTISAGRINLTAGTAWEIVLSNGSTYYCNEEAGTTAYDSSGNGKHGTITNATLATFHSTSTSVTRNYANELGYTLSGSTVISRNESSPTLDCAGNALQYAGPIGLPATVDVPCITGDGAVVGVDLGSQIIPNSGDFSLSLNAYIPSSPSDYAIILAQVDGVAWASAFSVFYYPGSSKWRVSYGSYSTQAVDFVPNNNAWNSLAMRKVGTNFYISVNGAAELSFTCPASITANENTKLLYSTGGTFSSARVSNLVVGTKTFPLQDGPGTSNTNRDVAWYASNGTGGVIANAIVNGTVANIWANRTNVARDACIDNGGGIAANGAFVVGIPGSGNDAAGNAKTLAVGTHGNPYSRFVPNYWNAPALVQIGSDNTDKYAPTDTVQSESIADTRFRKAGFVKYFATRTALTGTDKSNAEAYVA